jgi:hypothetical protein
MGFRLYTQSSVETFDDEAAYSFNEAGLLVVHLGGGKGRLTYSSHTWTVVEEPDKSGEYWGLVDPAGEK